MTIEDIKELLEPREERMITLHTGRGGMYLFHCCMETEITGCVRLHSLGKLPRIFSNLHHVLWDDYKNRYYKLVKKDSHVAQRK